LNTIHGMPTDPVPRWTRVLVELFRFTGATGGGVVRVDPGSTSVTDGRVCDDFDLHCVSLTMVSNRAGKAPPIGEAGVPLAGRGVTLGKFDPADMVVKEIKQMFIADRESGGSLIRSGSSIVVDTTGDAFVLSPLCVGPATPAPHAAANASWGVVWLRQRTDRPFTTVDAQTVHLVHSALKFLWEPADGARVETSHPVGRGPRVALTQRQHDALQHLLDGRNERDAARAIGMSVHTLHTHVKAIYRKFHVSSRAELMAMVLRSRED